MYAVPPVQNGCTLHTYGVVLWSSETKYSIWLKQMNKASTTATNYLNSYMRQGVRGGLILEGKNFNSVAIRHRLNLLAVTPENESLHALKQLTVAFFFFSFINSSCSSRSSKCGPEGSLHGKRCLVFSKCC